VCAGIKIAMIAVQLFCIIIISSNGVRMLASTPPMTTITTMMMMMTLEGRLSAQAFIYQHTPAA